MDFIPDGIMQRPAGNAVQQYPGISFRYHPKLQSPALKLSRYGLRYTARSGIVTLMEDLGSALRANPGMIMMGGGTPARIPAVERELQVRLQAIAADPERTWAMLGRYQGPQGDPEVRELLAALLRSEYGWDLSAANIAVTNGGQSAFAILANMLAGPASDGSQRLIQLPLVPEYLGYADTGITEPFFTATRPAIEILPDGQFKYRVDFGHLEIHPDAAALCVSRPTNPSGNVLTGTEVARLDTLARARGIPLIVDAAYGAPFPGIEFGTAMPYWSDNVILLASLSKLGLPGVRSGFLIAGEQFVQAFSCVNTILNLASGNPGPALATALLRDGLLLDMGRTLIRPWYLQKLEPALTAVQSALDGLPGFIHKPEGTFFLWLWLKDLPVDSARLYELLKAAGVLVIPGNNCFVGLQDDWDHTRQCLRLSYAIDADALRSGAAILGRVISEVYARG
jgi:valine--pyruvate aminotransferase